MIMLWWFVGIIVAWIVLGALYFNHPKTQINAVWEIVLVGPALSIAYAACWVKKSNDRKAKRRQRTERVYPK
jgi:hypothetical protein